MKSTNKNLKHLRRGACTIILLTLIIASHNTLCGAMKQFRSALQQSSNVFSADSIISQTTNIK